MSNVDDLRKLAQDFLAPELRALAVGLDAVEKSIGAVEKPIEDRLKSAEQLATERYQASEVRFKLAELTATERHQAIMNALDLNRRLTQVENKLEKPN